MIDMTKLLEVKQLKKSFKEKEVLKGISFEIEQGEILCFLGPNGAGKSTTINILTASLQKDQGEIQYEGQPIEKTLRSYKQQLGVVPQEIALYEQLSAERNVRFFASLYGLKGKQLSNAVEKALEFAGLVDRRKDKVKTFSGGMKRRLNIACAIAHSPKLVIMDEPTVGIDPQSRNHILDTIKQLRDKGMTVIYTTHYMEEVEAISTRIIIMDHGAMIAEGTKEALKESIQHEKSYYIEAENIQNLNEASLFHIEGVKSIQVDEGYIKVVTLRDVENLDRIISLLVDQKVRIVNIASEVASLETVFLKLTGRKLRD